MRWLKLTAATFGLIVLFLFVNIAPTLAANPGDVGTWTAGPTTPAAKGYSSTAAYNGYVYVMGGFPGSATVVYYAPLNSDGSVGTWTSSGNTLPGSGSYGAAAVVHGGYIYVIGGYAGGHLDTVYYAPLNPDGSVGNWTANGLNLPESLIDLNASVNGDYLYVTGGNDGSGEVDSVYYAHFNPDGSVGNWTSTSNTLPVAESAGESVVYNNYLYVVGGWNVGVAQSVVQYAPLNSDGSVGTWTIASNNMPNGLVLPSVVAYNGYLFVFGGFDGGPNDEVYSAPFNSDGSVGTWTTSPNSLPTTRYGAATSTYNGFVYVVGGYSSNGNNFVNTTHYAQLTGLPTPIVTPVSTTTVSSVTAPSTGFGAPNPPGILVALLHIAGMISVMTGIRVMRTPLAAR